jgi:hypothetical protein
LTLAIEIHSITPFLAIANPATTYRSGYSVVATCRPSDFDYVKSLGAEFAIDYEDENAGNQIREYTNNKLKYAWDTVSIKATAQLCADALSTSETNLAYGTLLPVQIPRTDVKTVTTIMHTTFGRHFVFGAQDMPASGEDFTFAKQFSDVTQKLLEKVRLPSLVYLGACTLTREHVGHIATSHSISVRGGTGGRNTRFDRH